MVAHEYIGVSADAKDLEPHFGVVLESASVTSASFLPMRRPCLVG